MFNQHKKNVVEEHIQFLKGYKKDITNQEVAFHFLWS